MNPFSDRSASSILSRLRRRTAGLGLACLTLLVALGAWAQHSWRLALAQAEREVGQVARIDAQSTALVLRDAVRFVSAVAEAAVEAQAEAAAAAGNGLGGSSPLPDGTGWLERERARRLPPAARAELWAPGDGQRLAVVGPPEGGPPAQALPEALAVRFAALPATAAVGLGVSMPMTDGSTALPVLGRLPGGERLVVWLPATVLAGAGERPLQAHADDAGAVLLASDGRVLWRASPGSRVAIDDDRDVGGRTLVARAPVPGHDAVVQVTLPLARVVDQWLRRSGLKLGLLVLALLAFGATAVVHQGRLRRAGREERRLRLEAARAVALLREALDASHDTTWQYDPTTRRLVLHRVPAALSTTEVEGASDSALWRALGPAEADALAADLDDASARAGAVDRLLPASVPGSGTAWFHLRGGPVGLDGDDAIDAAAAGPRPLAGTLRDVTAWIGTRDALAETAVALDRMGRIADVGHWRIDVATGDLALGEAARRILGLAAGTGSPAMTDVDPWTFGLPEPGAGAELRRARGRLEAGGDDWDLVLPIDDAGAAGGTRWLRWVGSAWRVDGRLLRIDGAVQDVTATMRMRAEVQALEERARWLGEAVAASGQLVIVTDARRRAVWCNDAFTRVSGYTLEDIRGRSPGDLLQPPDTPPELRARLRHSLDAGEPVRGVRLCNVARDGRRYWVDLEIRPVTGADGRLQCFIGLQTDVTRDRDREAALRDATRSFELATAQAQIGIWDHDLVNDTSVWTDAMYALVDVDRAIWTPTTPAFLARLHPADLVDAAGAYRCALADASCERWEGEYRVRRSDGGWRWLRSIARFDRDAEGRAVRAIGSAMDVSLAREIEAERAARAEADARSRAKSEFLSRISHELRTPLNAVLGYAQLLRARLEDGRADAEAMMPLQRIETAGWHLLALIDDVLDLSRIEAGQLAVQTAPTDLAALVDAAAGLLQPRADEAGIRLTVDAPRTAWALVDGTRLTEVVSNLVDNGIKYGRRGGAVDVSVRVEEGGWASVTVADDGLGLSPQQLARLFQPFDRLGRENTRIPGTGIGLAISKALVERMGGQLGVDSHEGRGSRFVVRLPAAAPQGRPSAATATATAATPVAGGERSPHGPATAPRRVLLVEDSEVNQMLVVEVLARLRPHWPVTVVGRLDEARPRLAAGEVDLLLLDLHLPDGHGLDLLEPSVLAHAGADLRVVVLTADVTPSTRRRADASAAGLTRAPVFLPKPFDLGAFERLVDGLDGLDELDAPGAVAEACAGPGTEAVDAVVRT